MNETHPGSGTRACTAGIAATLVLLLGVGGVARAQFAVIDVASLGQLVQQAQTLAQQLAAARAQLATAQAQYQSLIGNRGMQTLLAGTVRNYLPTQWTQVSSLLQGGSGGALAASFQGNLQANAVLSPVQLATLSNDERAQISNARQPVALLQALSQDALANASGRFAAIQQLINAIPTAVDQKGILDLQARISAEQGMLQNEQTKLQVLYQMALGQEWAARQREREQVVGGQGRFATRFEPVPR
jgi:type IV secretion system protein VirB5